jgi:hypothetical protein
MRRNSALGWSTVPIDGPMTVHGFAWRPSAAIVAANAAALPQEVPPGTLYRRAPLLFGGPGSRFRHSLAEDRASDAPRKDAHS